MPIANSVDWILTLYTDLLEEVTIKKRIDFDIQNIETIQFEGFHNWHCKKTIATTTNITKKSKVPGWNDDIHFIL